MNSSTLSERDRQIVLDHTRRYLLSTPSLLASAYFSKCLNSERQAARTLKRLEEQGLLNSVRLLARSLPDFEGPILSWSPYGQEPDIARLEYMLGKRWNTAARPTSVYFASRLAAKRFGGRGKSRLRKPQQASHDLMLTAVFLSRGRHLLGWLHEDLYADSIKRGDKHGDARIFYDDGSQLLIEVLGRYSKAHLRTIFPYCQRLNLPFELW